MTRKIKGHIFASDLQNDEKHLLPFFFFSSRVESFNSQFCFHERHKVDQTTQLTKKKFTPAFVPRTVRSKEFFWRQNRWVFPLYTYKWNKYVLCTFTEHRISGQNPASPGFVKYSTPAKDSCLAKERGTKPVTSHWGKGNRNSEAVLQTARAE